MSTALGFSAAASKLPFPLWRQLTSESIRKVYAPSSETEEFVPKGLHFGQRKLLLSEIEYLSWIIRIRSSTNDVHGDASSLVSNVSSDCSLPLIVVYAGAACGMHLPFLFSLFPMIKFILIDPNRFCNEVEAISKNESSQVLQIIHGYCTNDVCKDIRARYPPDKYDVHLISDIRSGNPPDLTNWENTQLIERDNTMQAEWCTSLQSISAMLKFHPPYPSTNVSVDPTPQSIRYFSGSCLWGIWAPRSSSEVRLVVIGPFSDPKRYTEKEYNCMVFEQQCCYYNSSNRYDADVKSERTVLSVYATHIMNKTESEQEDAILALSNQMSVQLGTPLLTPLDPKFSQDDARLFAFLYEGIKVNINELFKKFRPSVKLESVRKWAASREAGDLNSEHAPHGFWIFANSRNIMEAYGVKLKRKRQR
eukprot:Tbor_TRINITY_DN3702_c0_g1::TRINITY_DN3702_c0_g1_i1::g.2397::m.2397/K18776/MTR2, MT48; cap2 methyltransferase